MRDKQMSYIFFYLLLPPSIYSVSSPKGEARRGLQFPSLREGIGVGSNLPLSSSIFLYLLLSSFISLSKERAGGEAPSFRTVSKQPSYCQFLAFLLPVSGVLTVFSFANNQSHVAGMAFMFCCFLRIFLLFLKR